MNQKVYTSMVLHAWWTLTWFDDECVCTKLFESYEFIHMLQTQSSYTNNINLEYRLITYSNLITRPI